MLRALIDLHDEYALTIIVAHVNHQLRGEASDGDEAFVEEFCSANKIPFISRKADVRGYSISEGISLEEAGRRLRYELLEQMRIECSADFVATAHNRDDNAETVLLNLFRGSGLKGLCGIPPSRGNIVRPLIETPRVEIERFLSEKKIKFRVDASNLDPAYARNRVRNAALPVIKEQFGADASGKIAGCAARLREDEDFISLAAAASFGECLIVQTEAKVVLDAAKLSALHLSIRRRVLAEGIACAGGGLKDVGSAHFDAALSLLNGRTGGETALPNGLRVKKNYGAVEIFISGSENASKPFDYTLRPGVPVFVPELKRHIVFDNGISGGAPENFTKEFRYDKIISCLRLRSRLPGDKIYLGGVGRKKIQDYFTDRKIPRELRDGVPLVADGSEILWILEGSGRAAADREPAQGSGCVAVKIY